MNRFYIIHAFSRQQVCATCGARHEFEIEEPVESDVSGLGREFDLACEEAGAGGCPACAVRALPLSPAVAA